MRIRILIGLIYWLIICNFAHCRTPCGCVDWNLSNKISSWAISGRTPCGCVDWNMIEIKDISGRVSRTPCGCVDWNWVEIAALLATYSRTPCGCVDWNVKERLIRLHVWVAPRVGAWIETYDSWGSRPEPASHPVWVRGLKLSTWSLWWSL